MKRLTSLLLAAGVCTQLALPTSAAAAPALGSVVGHSLHTDIVAQIDGHPVPAYNVDGHMAVVTADLREYGFFSIWDGETRTTSVERAYENGEPLPIDWPDYTPEPLKNKVGTRAHNILATDVVTYVQGEKVDSYNINGRILIWFSALEPFGDIEWDPETRTTNLTLKDPMEIQLQKLRDYAAPMPDLVQLTETPEKLGTLATIRSSGPHGASYSMTFIRKNGTEIRIDALLPAIFIDYFAPRDIEFSSDGTKLTFITPVLELIEQEVKEGVQAWPPPYKDWGETRCTVDLVTGKMLSMVPLGQGLTEWSGKADTLEQGNGFGQVLDLAVSLHDEEAILDILEAPGPWFAVSANQYGVTMDQQMAMFKEDSGVWETEYGKAYSALSQLGVPELGIDFQVVELLPASSAELRAQQETYLTVTLNGQSIPGTLWKGGGNGHQSLNFRFDQPVSLKGTDELRIRIAMPE